MRKKSKLVCGVGVNDADYVVETKETVVGENGKREKKILWRCPFYTKWCSMLSRCYSSKYHEKRPTYEGCYVCEEWLTFSNFKAWMETQDWEEKHLDKDILFPRNKEYSPHTCVFVEGRINRFIRDDRNFFGKYMIGVQCTKVGRFRALGSGGGKAVYLGHFDTELEAHKAWLAFKLEQAKILAAEQSDPRVAKALIDRYENYVIEE